MSDPIYQIDTETWRELKKIYESKESHKCYWVIKYIQEKLGITHDVPEDNRLVLYGVNGKREEFVGHLQAMARGIVILDAPDERLIGLLERSSHINRVYLGILFKITCFQNGAELEIGKPKEAGAKHLVSVFASINRDEWFELGVDRQRWKSMKKWLDKWLPEEK